MFKRFAAILTVICLAAAMSYGDVWQDLAKYQYGEGDAGEQAEKLVQTTPVAGHGAIEDALIALVSSKDATSDGKGLACRLLQQIGTEKCVSAVATLLGDEVLAHNARLVLQRMGSAKADAAMLAMLESAPDKLKIGIIGSLADRRAAAAVPAIVKLAASNDPAIAGAAICALGRIGGDAAAACLTKLTAAEALQPVHLTALVDCARGLQGAAAIALYQSVLDSNSHQHRIAALAGMIAADEKKATGLMIGFIKGDDAKMRAGALTLVVGEGTTMLASALAEALPSLPDDIKADVITVLGARRDPAAATAVAACLTSQNEAVRTAAIKSICNLDAGEATIKALLGMGGAGVESIARMTGPDVNNVLIKTLGDAGLRLAAMRALVARNCFEAAPALVKLAASTDAEVRKAAWDGLGTLTSEDDIATLAKAAFAVQDPAELNAAIGALRRVCGQAGDKGKCFDAVAGYYDGTTDAGKAGLIEMASMVGNESALNLVKKAMGGSAGLRATAVRALAAWPNPSAAGALYDVAKSSPDEKERLIALRGYITIAGKDKINLNPKQRAEMCQKADELATRPDEKKLIISALQKAPHPISLRLVSKYLDDASLRREAEPVAVTLIEKKAGSPAEIRELAAKLLSSKDKATVDKAKRALE